MVLRSGTIIPFQFKEDKKLIMIGVPAEDRILSIWDFKNVVQTAFGIINCEFRNKKIDFPIPEYMLLHYLDQRRDLTNFVIEIEQKDAEINGSDGLMMSSIVTDTSTVMGRTESQRRIAQSNNRSRSHDREIQTDDQQYSQKYRKSKAAVFTNSIAEPCIEIETKSPPRAIKASTLCLTSKKSTKEINCDPIYIRNTIFKKEKDSVKKQKRNRKRDQKTTFQQKNVYLTFLESHEVMSTTKPIDDRVKPLWKKLTNILNSARGPMKSTAEWIKTFDSWRYTTFYKFRYNSSITGVAALEPRNFKPISEQEERAYMLWIRNTSTTPKEFRDTSAAQKLSPYPILDGSSVDIDHYGSEEKSNFDLKIGPDTSLTSDAPLQHTAIKTEIDQVFDSEDQRITDSPINSSDDENWSPKRKKKL